jgi:hypothetical protein
MDILKAQQKPRICVQAFEVLITAGLSSPRRSIVNGAIVFWNQLLGGEENFTYSEDLAKVLERLRLVSDIQTPAPLGKYEVDKVYQHHLCLILNEITVAPVNVTFDIRLLTDNDNRSQPLQCLTHHITKRVKSRHRHGFFPWSGTSILHRTLRILNDGAQRWFKAAP